MLRKVVGANFIKEKMESNSTPTSFSNFGTTFGTTFGATLDVNTSSDNIEFRTSVQECKSIKSIIIGGGYTTIDFPPYMPTFVREKILSDLQNGYWIVHESSNDRYVMKFMPYIIFKRIVGVFLMIKLLMYLRSYF